MTDVVTLDNETTVALADTDVQVVSVDGEVLVVSVGEQGPAGPPGKSAPVGGISSDPNNAITNGGDGGLFAPDALPTDPVAYYILARS